MRFVDTNVLLYAVSTDAAEAGKLAIAREILRASDFALSVQVLQEFFVQATRNSRAGRLSHEHAVGLITTWTRVPVQDLTYPIVAKAMAAVQRWQVSYWDAAIIESARAAGCTIVLSEDLHDGQNFDGVRVVNPFRGIQTARVMEGGDEPGTS
jgi:predicted nucleic acid-binding protein